MTVFPSFMQLSFYSQQAKQQENLDKSTVILILTCGREVLS